MAKVIRSGVYYMEGKLMKEAHAFMTSDKKEAALKNTVTHAVLSRRGAYGEEIVWKADTVVLSDFVDILRAADAMGLDLPVRTVLFGYGGDVTEFGISAAEKWGCELVSDSLAEDSVYIAERVAAGGDLLCGNAEFACGPLGAMGVRMDESAVLGLFCGQEAALGRPETVAVYLRGKPAKGVGPTDVALEILSTFQKAGNFGEGKILEVFGTGVENLSMDFRIALDYELRETGCLSTVWATDGKTEEYLAARGRDFLPLSPVEPAFYDGGITVDLSRTEPMIGYRDEILTVREFLRDPPAELLHGGKVFFPCLGVEGTAANYETISEVAEILRGSIVPPETALYVLPASKAVTAALSESGALGVLLASGCDYAYSDRPADGFEALDAGFFEDGTARLDARTLAATAQNGGFLTAAGSGYSRRFKKNRPYEAVFSARVFDGRGKKGGILAYTAAVPPLPDLMPLPEDLMLAVGEFEFGAEDVAKRLDGAQLPEKTETAGLTLSEEGGFDWTEAADAREQNILAVLAKEFEPADRAALISWGILPLTMKRPDLKEGDYVLLEKVASSVRAGESVLRGKVFGKRKTREAEFTLGTLTDAERHMLLAGGLINLKGE